MILVGNTAIDFDAWDSSALKNIEVIDLTGGDHQLSRITSYNVCYTKLLHRHGVGLGDFLVLEAAALEHVQEVGVACPVESYNFV